MASLPMGTFSLDQEAAIKELGRGYDMIKQLQGLHQLKPKKEKEVINMHDLAETLFSEALQTLNHALCIMKSGSTQVEVKSEIVAIESGWPGHSSHESVASYESNQRIQSGRGKRRRIGDNSWINNTTMPYDDGYKWRKYGDKKITGSNFSRSYFKCTYKEQGCQAQKLVQQTSKNHSPLFQVTYKNKHTCRFHTTTPPLMSPPQDSGVDRMLHLREYGSSRPQLSNQGSHLGDANLGETSTSASMVEGSCDWDMESLLMYFVGDSSYDCLLS